jgi:hypothetical protein
MDFFKKYMDEDIEKIKLLTEEAKKLKVKIFEKSIDLTRLLSFIDRRSIPIVLLDWNIVRNREKEGYMGHYVPLVGFDNNSVYVNNGAGRYGKRLQQIDKRTFDKARKARGSEETVLIIFKK